MLSQGEATQATDIGGDKDDRHGDDADFVREKRTPAKPSVRPNDIYVTRSSSFVSQLQRIRYRLAKDFSDVHIRAIGPAINRAINLALTVVEESCGTLAHATKTSTVLLVDDMVPLGDEELPRSEVRSGSAIDIRVYKLSAAAYSRFLEEASAQKEASQSSVKSDEEPDDASDASGAKSRKRKRNRASTTRRSGSAPSGSETSSHSTDLYHAQAIAAECKQATELVSQRPSASSGPRRSRRSASRQSSFGTKQS